MAIKNKSVLQGQSVEIRDETVDFANTATRVGTMFLDLTDSKASVNNGSGLTYNTVDDRFDFGGNLLANTNINTGAFTFSVVGSISLSNVGFSFNLGNTFVFSDLRAVKNGIQYGEDYLNWYTDRTIPDWYNVKKYADELTFDLSDLVDVDLTGLQIGHILYFNGSKWYPSVPPTGGGGGDSLWTASGDDIFYQAGNVEIRDGKLFKIFDAGTTDSWSFSVDANNNLIVSGPVNGNAHFSGDVIAFSSLMPPAASWWDDLPIASVSTLGGIKVGTNLTIDPGGTLHAEDGGTATWGGITGTLSDQTDLQFSLDGKSPTSHLHTGVYAPVSHTHTQSEISDLDLFWVKTGNNIRYSAGEVQVGSAKNLRLYDLSNTESWTISLDANNNLILSGPTNKNLHVSGDVVAYSGLSGPAASWWDDIPVDGVTIQLNGSGQLEVIGGFGVTDHGALTGLGDDDHSQYHNDARGDLRYSLLGHNHSGTYEPAFSKNTGFNKNFGTTAGTVSEGNHSHSGFYWVSATGGINYTGGNVGISTAVPTERLHVTGNILASGEITAYSDRKIKKNIESLDSVFEAKRLMRINPVSYEIIDDKSKLKRLGVIAQELKEIYPELVSDGDTMSVNYLKLIPSLIATIQNLSKRIEKLENK